MTTLSADLREALAKVGTSTLTGVLNRRGLRSMTLFDVWPMRPEQPRMVGLAFTMRFIPSREDMDGPTSTNRSMVQPQAMEECPPGHVLMIDSRGDSRAASAGDLYVGRLKARGAAGIVTDGGFRDTDGVFKTGLPAYHRRPSSPPSPIAHRQGWRRLDRKRYHRRGGGRRGAQYLPLRRVRRSRGGARPVAEGPVSRGERGGQARLRGVEEERQAVR